MPPFAAARFFRLGATLKTIQSFHSKISREGSSFYGEPKLVLLADENVPEEDRQGLAGFLTDLAKECADIKLERSALYANDLVAILQNDITNRRIAFLVTELSKHIKWDMEKQLFMYVSPEKAAHYKNDKVFGDDVYNCFPHARFDLIEAGNCLAFENYTAAVFHLMRAAEWGLRALCIHFGFKKIKNRRKLQAGKVELVPIEYTDWERMINQLQSKVDKKAAKLQRGSAKQKLQEFYNPVLADIRAIRDAWRNHVMHTRSEYKEEDVLAAMAHVKGLMIALAKRGVKQF